jgi:hypothetical protein
MCCKGKQFIRKEGKQTRKKAQIRLYLCKQAFYLCLNVYLNSQNICVFQGKEITLHRKTENDNNKTTI